jgi:hypothetical protein
MPIDSDLDVVHLRRVLRDLVALSAVPEAWVERAPRAIADGLVDVLVTSLHVDFAFVRLRDANGGAAVEIVRGNAWPALLDRLQPYIAEDARLSRTEIVPGVGDGTQGGGGIVIPVGLNGERGLVAAACDRAGFPGEIDRLLLSVAANHAATAFRMARLVDDHRRAEAALRDSEQQLRKARDVLETKVAEQTAELRRSESYLAQAQRLSRTGTWAFNPTTTLYWSEDSARSTMHIDRSGRTCRRHVIEFAPHFFVPVDHRRGDPAMREHGHADRPTPQIGYIFGQKRHHQRRQLLRAALPSRPRSAQSGQPNASEGRQAVPSGR